MKSKISILAIGLLLGGAALLSPLSAGAEEPEVQSAPTQRYLGWYMRTVVEATDSEGKSYLHDSAGVFGRLKGSSYRKDRHDIPAMGTGIFQILFTPRWESEGTRYYSDYRNLRGKHPHRSNVWSFEVRNEKGVDLSEAEFTIRIEGPVNAYQTPKGIEERPSADKTRLRRLHLVDLDNDRVYRYRAVKRMTFSMEGSHVRHFRWVLGRVNKADRKMEKAPQSEEARLFTPNPENPDSFGTPPEM